MLPQPIVLLVLDGWGYSPNTQYNAIYAAQPKNFNALWKRYPHKLIDASGEAVGLPKGYMGNSQVGHLTIGAGRIVPHLLVRISQELEDTHAPWTQIIDQKLQKNPPIIHLIGLVSNGGVHSHLDHLIKLITYIRSKTTAPIAIHAILDGRDTPPNSSLSFLEKLSKTCKENNAIIASIAGRWYAMDRDENWERTATYCQMLTDPNYTQEPYNQLIKQYLAEEKSDEFFSPTKLTSTIIKPNDLCICWNYRSDRMRQLVSWLTNQALPAKKHFMPDHQAITANIITMTEYHPTFNLSFLFTPVTVENTLFERLHKQGLRTCAIAETEKYAHITYFFNGGREYTSPYAQQILISSKIVDRFDKIPQMSAQEITDVLCQKLAQNSANVYLVNLANADMVGHTGNFNATVEAIKCVDQQLGRIYDAVQHASGTLIVTADHGNAEQMWNTATNTPHTSHTTNPVPLIVTRSAENLDKIDGLADIAKLFE
ncbi:TPA: 2,3-bisphosphoglycerate-independent phosphoglycerate mutase [Candidatus Dependentiae bacterium]|nr:2,3-bisphosphoglycerate-independent phosphoglycerate mutase [Candidatus Dependentiae bacterium]